LSNLIDLTFFSKKEAPEEAPFFWRRDLQSLINIDPMDRKLIFEQRREVKRYGIGVDKHESF